MSSSYFDNKISVYDVIIRKEEIIMQMKLVGIAPVNFTNNVGEKIVGQNAFVLYKDENVNGLKADKLFLKEGIEMPKDVKINDMLDISFTNRGRVEMIYKV